MADIYGGTAPGARVHEASAYRWPLVPALALSGGDAGAWGCERVAGLFAEQLGNRVLAYSGVPQKDQPAAQIGWRTRKCGCGRWGR